MLLREESFERRELGVTGRIPVTRALQQGEERPGVPLQRRRERRLEQRGPHPAEALRELGPVDRQHLSGSGGEGRRPERLAQLRCGCSLVIVGEERRRVGIVVGEGVVEQLALLRPDRQLVPRAQRLQEDVVAEHVPLHRSKERRSAGLQALEEVRQAEPLEPAPGLREPGEHLLLAGRGGCATVLADVVAETVARQLQRRERLDYVVGVEPSIGVVGGPLVEDEGDVARHPVREEDPVAVGHGEVAPPRLGIALGVVPADEAPRPPHQEETHHVPPVVHVLALLEGRERSRRALVPLDEDLLPSHLAEQVLGADAEIAILGHEEPELAPEVEVGLVVGRRREQHAPALVPADVVREHAVAPSVAVPEVVALVHHHDRVAPQRREHPLHHAERKDAGLEPVPLDVPRPHGDEVLRADDEGAVPELLFEDARQRGRHQRLAEADHVAQHHAAPRLYVVGGDLDRRLLEVEEQPVDVLRDTELRQAGPSVPRQVPGDLQVHVERRDDPLRGPRLVDRAHQLLREVERESVAVAIVEPPRELVAGVDVQHVDVELALPRQPREREVAAPEEGDPRAHRVAPVDQVELRVERPPQVKAHLDPPLPELPGEQAQRDLVLARRHPARELLPEVVGDLPPRPDGPLLVDGLIPTAGPVQCAAELLRWPVHADEHPNRWPARRERLDRVLQDAPAPEVEVPDTEVCGSRAHQGRTELRREVQLDVVVDPGHGGGGGRLAPRRDPTRGRPGERKRGAAPCPVRPRHSARGSAPPPDTLGCATLWHTGGPGKPSWPAIGR